MATSILLVQSAGPLPLPRWSHLETVLSKEAYRWALQQALGEAGWILRALLMEKTEGQPGPDWRRVNRALQRVAPEQAKLVPQMAPGNFR